MASDGGLNLDIGQRKTAILILTHLRSYEVDELYSEIKRYCPSKYDVVLLCDNSDNIFPDSVENGEYFNFTAEDLAKLPYPGKSVTTLRGGANQADSYHKRFHFDPANVELPLLLFYRRNPQYDFYWTIEYDVRFTGTWDKFFSCFESSDSDLLGTTLTRRAEIPNWFHWPSLVLDGRPIEVSDHLRGFFPIYRLSARALAQLDKDYRSQVRGHFECLIPTLLWNAGMKIEDIGGSGAFVKPGNLNRFYRNTPRYGTLSPGTIVYRPVMHCPGREPDMLWHPVKRLPAWQVALINGRRVARALVAHIRRFGWAPQEAKKRRLAS